LSAQHDDNDFCIFEGKNFVDTFDRKTFVRQKLRQRNYCVATFVRKTFIRQNLPRRKKLCRDFFPKDVCSTKHCVQIKTEKRDNRLSHRYICVFVY
jgi:cobalamin-dependent methionine synthase I